jgi:hypothetical protein
MKQMPGSSPGMTLSLVRKKSGPTLRPQGDGVGRSVEPVVGASLGGNTTLPVGLFRRSPAMIQKGRIAVGQGLPPMVIH